MSKLFSSESCKVLKRLKLPTMPVIGNFFNQSACMENYYFLGGYFCNLCQSKIKRSIKPNKNIQGVFDNLREKVKTAFGLNYTGKFLYFY